MRRGTKVLRAMAVCMFDIYLEDNYMSKIMKVIEINRLQSRAANQCSAQQVAEQNGQRMRRGWRRPWRL